MKSTSKILTEVFITCLSNIHPPQSDPGNQRQSPAKCKKELFLAPPPYFLTKGNLHNQTLFVMFLQTLIY